MSYDEESSQISVSVKEATAAVVIVLTLLGTMGTWAVLPQRIGQVEKTQADFEMRMRGAEAQRVDLAEMKTVLYEIKRRLDKTP